MLDIVQALPKDKDEQHTSSPNPVTSETNLVAINGQTESVLEQTNKKFNCIQEKLSEFEDIFVHIKKEFSNSFKSLSERQKSDIDNINDLFKDLCAKLKHQNDESKGTNRTNVGEVVRAGNFRKFYLMRFYILFDRRFSLKKRD